MVGIGLVLATLAIYAQAARHAYIDLDDDLYVTANSDVLAGLSGKGLGWALTTFHASNWHPLTWLSHMLDISLFGVSAGGAHLTSVLLHALNALLAFLVFRAMTGALGRSAIVAALFAVHPMHVESVAWVAERKDVLSTAFGLLTMAAYLRYVRRLPAEDGTAGRGPGRRWPALACLFLALGLMAKPMLVTLPFVLLLLDYWPLGRLRRSTASGPGGRFGLVASAWPLVREKLPLFGLALASGLVTFAAQRAGGAVQQLQNVPISYRLSNAAISSVRYLYLLIWPHGLAVYYPFPQAGYPPWQAVAALAFLVAMSASVWKLGVRLPYLVTGWLWYLATLLPVIGLVQVGGQAMADRYTYLPYFGPFVMIVWGAGDLLERRGAKPALGAILAIMPLAILGCLAWRQTGFWKDSETLFGRALSLTRDNAVVEFNLGVALGRQGRSEEAAARFAEAARIWPGFYDAEFNLGVARAAQGRLDDAVVAYTRAIAVRPDAAAAELNLGGALAQQGRVDEALVHFRRAVTLDPASAQGQTNLGLALLRLERAAEALDHLRRAVALDPRSAEAENNLGLALLVGGVPGEAAEHFERALALNPAYDAARRNLARARAASPAPPPP